MSNVLLPIQPGQLPSGYCFVSWQKTLNDFSAAQNAILDGRSFFNFGSTTPLPENEIYPWLRTTDGRWYFFSGNWISPVNYDTNERRLWVGTLTGAGSLEEYDGGDSNAPSDRSGPMWVEDTEFRGRVPMGPGDIPDATPKTTTVKTLTVEENYGAGLHTITEAEGATGAHTHGFGKYLSGAVGLASAGNNTVSTYTGAVVQGISVGSGPDTTVNLFTLPSGQTASGVTATPVNIVNPVRGCYIVKWSGRLYRKV